MILLVKTFLGNLKDHPFLCSMALNVMFFGLYFYLGEWKFGSLDDFFMSSVLVGAYGGQFNPHLYFINAIYAYFLKPLYMFFPNVGWYSIIEALEIFASFVAIVYGILYSEKDTVFPVCL